MKEILKQAAGALLAILVSYLLAEGWVYFSSGGRPIGLLGGATRAQFAQLQEKIDELQERVAAGEDEGPTPLSVIDFGDDRSPWAHDDECDDPRFEGDGMGLTESLEDLGHDATDCRTLYQADRIRLR